jgi:hypothetical protein
MLHSWTGIDISGLVGSQINSPENGIYMNDVDHSQFGSFLFYFDKVEDLSDRCFPFTVPSTTSTKCKCSTDYLLANGEETADVEFLANTEVPPPNPQLPQGSCRFCKGSRSQ